MESWELTTNWRLDDWIGCVCLYTFEEQTFMKQHAVYEIHSILQRSSFKDVMNSPQLAPMIPAWTELRENFIFRNSSVFFLITVINVDASNFKIFIFWPNFNVRDFKLCKKITIFIDLLWQMFRFLTFWRTNSETKNSCNGLSQLSLSDFFL